VPLHCERKAMKLFRLLILLSVASVGRADIDPKDTATPAGKAPLPDSPFQPDLTPGYVLIEGDIQIPLGEYRNLLSGAKATFGGIVYWVNNPVPYSFVRSGPGAVSFANQILAINAMTEIAARAGITFRTAAAGEDQIRFQNSGFNNSPVGDQGSTNIINITNW